MKSYYSLFFICFLILCFAKRINAKTDFNQFLNDTYFNIDYGVKISGIKIEDFVSSNISPVIRCSFVKKCNENTQIRFGYQGKYFFLISDDYKHKYDFYYLEILKKINSYCLLDNKNEIFIHFGSGYFYNHFYESPNFCGILGLLTLFPLNDKIKFIVDLSSVVGWDIYQGNEDILPSFSIGILYDIF